MAKKKQKNQRNDGNNVSGNKNVAKTDGKIAVKYKHNTKMVLSMAVAIVSIIIYAIISRGSIQNNNTNEQNNKKDAFLNWFVNNGGTFHRVIINDDTAMNVTIEEFQSYGGWGLALPLPSNITEQQQMTDECQIIEDEQQYSTNISTSNTPIIRHLDPLFTVPSTIIISVSSILQEYAYPRSPQYLPTFYSQVNKILNKAFPQGTGLAARGMGLVEQDVVIAMYLMVEECQHHHTHLFNNNEDSYWGRYLDVLPQYTIPRLDTFDDDAYAALKDENLEYVGRRSRHLLEQMYNMSPSEGQVSLSSVVRDMIQLKKNESETIPDTCVSFDTFHRFVGITSSRAMVLKSVKYLTPLAEMINYSPKVKESKDWINAPFDLYHTLSEDGSITVRSDRDIFISTTDDSAVQIFEDYGPVDNSLFLEAHGFVPYENPNNCAKILGSSFFRRPVASGRYDEGAELVLRALKTLYLIHPEVKKFESLEDVCVRENLSMVDDGNTIGRKPASDSIAIVSLILGDHDNPTWNRIETEFGKTFNSLKEICITAIHSGDRERIESRCARYTGSNWVVKTAVQSATSRTIAKFEENNDTMSELTKQLLQQAQSEGSAQLALALRFRLEERKILTHIANSIDNEPVLPQTTSDEQTDMTKSLDKKVEAFNSFIQTLNLPLNKIEAKVVGDGMRVGAFAIDDIELDEPYISIHGNSVIDVDTALADVKNKTSSLARLLKKYSVNMNGSRSDGFDALLIYLLHERFVMKEESRWWPYLDLLPSIEELSEYHPLFFDEAEIDGYLAGSDVRQFIIKYQRHAAQRNGALVSDLDVNTLLGSDLLFDKQKVLWATAIVDSRSIWWNKRRHLVPLLDLVNADSKGRAHETKMANHTAVTRASRRIKEGTQVFENYAQPNYLLFSYHGFLLEDNPNDCALLDGLTINRNDIGAKTAQHHLHSMSPTFCIRELSSIEELANFLRVKHGLFLDTTNAEVDDEVRPYLIEVLEGRIARLTEAIEANNEVKSDSPSRLKLMNKVIQNDLVHFQHALANHIVVQG